MNLQINHSKIFESRELMGIFKALYEFFTVLEMYSKIGDPRVKNVVGVIFLEEIA